MAKLNNNEVIILNRLGKLETTIDKTNDAIGTLIETHLALEDHLKEIILSKDSNPLIIKGASKIDFVAIKDIIYCTADLSYTNIVTLAKTKIVSTKSLNEFEDFLPNNFFRISKSVLINLNYMTSFNKRTNQIQMKNKDLLSVARRRKADFLAYLGGELA